MDRLWSPWRSAHVEQAAERQRGATAQTGAQSVFSLIAADDNDEENLVLHRGETCFALMNLYPYNNGHVLIVPYREVRRYNDLTPDERVEMAELTASVVSWLQDVLNPDGFNIGINQGDASGAGIPEHLHQHVVPRWSGDTSFMSTLAETRVIPEAIQETFGRLREAADRSAPPYSPRKEAE